VYLNIETTHEKFEAEVDDMHLEQLDRAARTILVNQFNKDQWESADTEELDDFLRVSITIENITITTFIRPDSFEPDVDEEDRRLHITDSNGKNLFVAITKDDQTLVHTYSPGPWEHLIISQVCRSVH
jgi:hypothetical protein